MPRSWTRVLLILAFALALPPLVLSQPRAGDWPQWRGPNRDNKVIGFTEPKAWPKELKQKWQTKVGLGDASPDLVGEKIYVFTQEGNDEVIRCLDAANGKEVWKDQYAAQAVTNRAAAGHPGPRSSPAVAEGKVCTLGVGEALSCLDANTGKVAWRKDAKAWPMFFTATSPIIVEGKCIAFLGGQGKGELTAFDLNSGDEKWKWTGEGPAYGSPVLMTVDGTNMLVTLTQNSLIGVGVADGKLLWKTAYKSRYNSETPVVNGQSVICSGAGTVEYKIEKKGDGFEAKEVWKQTKSPAGIYNTPVLKDGLLYGLTAAGRSATNICCMDAKTGDVLWTDTTSRGECGTILDAGPVLFCLTNNSELLAFKPSKTGYEELAKYKVADTPTWAYPIIAGNRVIVKDKDSVILWAFE